MICILFFRFPIFEKIVTEPNLSEMGLVFVLSVDLFYGVENFSLEMKPFPDFGESSPSQLLTFQVPIDEGFVLEFAFPRFFKVAPFQ